jgi:hypothetical protein
MSAPVPVPVAPASKTLSQLQNGTPENGIAFSPSNFSPATIHKFSSQDSLGVPLQTSWTFWVDKANKGSTAAEYTASLKKIYTFATVQGFWSVLNHIPGVHDLPNRSYYHLMREERQPLWEDPIISRGGTWRIKCYKKDTVRVWKELLLASIGEQFDSSLAPGDNIAGLSVSPRPRDDLIQIWNYDAQLAVNDNVLEKVHSLVPDVTFLAEFYKPHQTHSAYEGEKTDGYENTSFNITGVVN